MIRKRHFMGGIAASVILHAALVTTWALANQTKGSVATGEGGLLVNVGIAGSYSEQADQREEMSSGDLPEIKKAEAEPEPEPEPEAEPEPEPVQEAKPDPKPQAKPDSKPSETSSKTTEAIEESSSTSETTRMATRATGTGERVETGGNTGGRADYLSSLMARIARQKRYPRSARSDGVTGIVTVRFVVQRNGKVKQTEIIESSGDSRLDNEALAMLNRASPLPAIPSSLSNDAMTLTLPIEFSLKAQRKVF